MKRTLSILVDGTEEDRHILEWASREAAGCSGDVDRALEFARAIGRDHRYLLGGHPALLWSVLATIGAVDLTVARVVEPHLDALSILGEAAVSPRDDLGVDDSATWGVFAAESPKTRLTAEFSDGQWTLDGTKPWCSLAGSLSHALVTAYTSPSTRRLFAVSLSPDSVVANEGEWHARGLTAITSGSVTFSGTVAHAVGDDGWYLERPGFAGGGIGVAACWWGGAVGVARRAVVASREREPDQIGLMHIGALDLAVQSSRLALVEAAASLATGDLDRDAAKILSGRTRARVARDAEEIIDRVAHALGPAPLALEEDHARRVADLQVYVRQHHAERDVAQLGRKLLADENFQW